MSLALPPTVRILNMIGMRALGTPSGIPDNPNINTRRFGAFVKAQAMFLGDDPDVPLGGLPGSSSASGRTRPHTPSTGPRKERRVEPSAPRGKERRVEPSAPRGPYLCSLYVAAFGSTIHATGRVASPLRPIGVKTPAGNCISRVGLVV